MMYGLDTAALPKRQEAELEEAGLKGVSGMEADEGSSQKKEQKVYIFSTEGSFRLWQKKTASN